MIKIAFIVGKFPSLSETFTLNQITGLIDPGHMEAMAMGLPVLSTQHSGISELIKDGISGFLVSKRDIDALAEKLNYPIEHSELWSDMFQAGHFYVKEHHDINQLNERWVEIYRKLVRN